MGLGVSLGQRCGPRGDDEWCLVNPVPGESELMSSSITTALGPCLLLLGGGGDAAVASVVGGVCFS